MANEVRPRVKVPKSAKAGEVVSLKTLITHPMESGQRRDAAGAVIPRSIINRFTCELNGQMVIDVALHPSVSSNPFLEFDARVDAAGEFVFTWYDDDGSIYVEKKPIEVG